MTQSGAPGQCSRRLRAHPRASLPISMEDRPKPSAPIGGEGGCGILRRALSSLALPYGPTALRQGQVRRRAQRGSASPRNLPQIEHVLAKSPDDLQALA